ncbi:MAG: hypothetical protein KDC46_13085 [Thermoleophilia bacterium]|nr:hypothetical protein [Thermoleophilia bacterium]
MRHRHRIAIAAVVVAILMLLASLALAGDNPVSRTLGFGGSVHDPFEGPSSLDVQPASMALESALMLNKAERATWAGSGAPDFATRQNERVLLHGSSNGVLAEISAWEVPKGTTGRGAMGPSKERATCYALVTSSRFGGGGIACSPAFEPGFPGNYAASYGADQVDQTPTTTVFGIVASYVTQIRIHTETGTQDAVMGDHSFFWFDRENPPVSIEAITADGRSISSTQLFDQQLLPDE